MLLLQLFMTNVIFQTLLNDAVGTTNVAKAFRDSIDDDADNKRNVILALLDIVLMIFFKTELSLECLVVEWVIMIVS